MIRNLQHQGVYNADWWWQVMVVVDEEAMVLVKRILRAVEGAGSVKAELDSLYL